MKVLFSEHKSDYAHYIFPYAIWAIPEPGEKPSQLFAHGFLPATRDLSRFYLCRQIRIHLPEYAPSSENRRIFRKGEGIEFSLIPRNEFEYTAERRESYKTYADIKFGKDVMTYERLDSLFHSQIINHLLVFYDREAEREVGTVTLYLEQNTMAYYYYAFYDLNYYPRNLGMYMMTSAVDYFAKKDFSYLYLGTCYSRNALYKTQFQGAEFFTGFRWSKDLKELKYLIRRENQVVTHHLLETDEYLKLFYDGELSRVVETGIYQMKLS